MTTVEAPTVDLADIDARLDRVRANYSRYVGGDSPDLLALLDIADTLRKALKRAAYFTGDEECLDGECGHPASDCPALKLALIATSDDAIRVIRLRDRLKDIRPDEADVEELRLQLDAIRRIADPTTDAGDL